MSSANENTLLVSTPLGTVSLTARKGALVSLTFQSQKRGGDQGGGKSPVLQRVKKELDRYFQGTLREFSIPLAPQGTEFQKRVWKNLCQVPWGETISYGELAKKVNAFGAARAVGSAMKKNPIPIIIPCHRVIRSDGHLGGYSSGLDKKIELLEMEGLKVSSKTGQLPGNGKKSGSLKRGEVGKGSRQTKILKHLSKMMLVAFLGAFSIAAILWAALSALEVSALNTRPPSPINHPNGSVVVEGPLLANLTVAPSKPRSFHENFEGKKQKQGQGQGDINSGFVLSFGPPTPKHLKKADARGIANYWIKARLLEKKKRIDGTLDLVWRNTSPHPTNTLAFHLYMNAFKSNDTLFMRESRGSHRGNRLKKGQWGHIEIKRLVVDGVERTKNVAMAGCLKPPCVPSAQKDETVLRVALDRPVPANSKARIHMEFQTKLPRVFARTGYVKNFFMVAQWFPKIGVLEGEGWRCHGFHPNSEFYADFGDYFVTLDLPKGFLVGATGKRQRVEKKGQRRIHHFHARDVHDFAFVTGDQLVKKTVEKNNISFALLAPRSLYKKSLPHLYLTIRALKKIEYLLGPYPYDHLTVVVPPTDASGAGGMEYPTLFATKVTPMGFPGALDDEQTTVHELIHQYFQGMVASNEAREPWLDEGFTTYFTGVILDDLYGANTSFYNLWGLHLGYYPMTRLCMKYRPDWDPIGAASWDHASMETYGVTSYCKATMLLKSLEGLLGKKAMLQLLRTYVARFRFRHPTTEDFCALVDEMAGHQTGDILRQAVKQVATVDHQVFSIENHRVKKKVWATIRLHRRGRLPWPVEIEIKTADGHVLKRTWRDSNRWKTLKLKLSSKVTEVQLDPKRKVWLDLRRWNDGLTLEADGAAARNVAMRFGAALQWGLQNLGF